ncbi:hypothetical protein [Tractidigestivibacter sp.]|uniref:hypothetical protein n=1 Tax=Tractidigestivibacter sp. TaxID=2847320 RepID=UPI002A7FDCBF|nr:hypothetical protein [Tractidigestivibacter sp.]MDD7584249.1 hypothetical protein [Coriobacteriaceae bacterium]MDY4534517.1 hypothetical protein [Tractidigestivibacter sp.]MDY5271178.1 hypothetical protein [Tractidigestivibacter sp.]
MSKVTYGQGGYDGASMSTRARLAYATGEMPRSKWTKAAIIDAIKGCCEDLGLAYDATVEKAKKADLFGAFMEVKSWHHTGKYAAETDFYGLDEQAVVDRFAPMPEAEAAARRASREAEEANCAARREAEAAERRAEERGAVEALGPAYEYIARRNPAFTPARTIVRTMAADEAMHPERYEARVAKSGRVMLRRRSSGVEMPVERACTYEIF